VTGQLYIVSGSSGSGKTTLVDMIMEQVDGVERAAKYSERASRGPQDDTTHVDEVDSKSYDITYVINDYFYGVKTADIERQLGRGVDVFIILSDFRVVRRVKERFGERATTVYVSSAVDPDVLRRVMADRHRDEFSPTPGQSTLLRRQFYRLQCAAELGRWSAVLDGMSDLLDEWNHVVPHAESARIRSEKIRSFHLRYTDQITLFDQVVLNHTQDRPEDMVAQMKQLLLHKRGLRRIQSPVLFVVAAASGAGKGLLMETTGRLMSDGVIRTVTKQALRDPKPNDRRDGMVSLGHDGLFGDEFDFRWEFHKGGGQSGTRYAISTSEVERGLQQGVHQIVVSNIAVFDDFRRRFGDHTVFLYLHATRSEAEVRDYQLANCATVEEAEQRIREIRDVHEAYMENIWRFDHVLLNTTFKEDLFDQMLELIHHYSRVGSMSSVA
jgi:guanylate kinase